MKKANKCMLVLKPHGGIGDLLIIPTGSDGSHGQLPVTPLFILECIPGSTRVQGLVSNVKVACLVSIVLVASVWRLGNICDVGMGFRPGRLVSPVRLSFHGSRVGIPSRGIYRSIRPVRSPFLSFPSPGCPVVREGGSPPGWTGPGGQGGRSPLSLTPSHTHTPEGHSPTSHVRPWRRPHVRVGQIPHVFLSPPLGYFSPRPSVPEDLRSGRLLVPPRTRPRIPPFEPGRLPFPNRRGSPFDREGRPGGNPRGVQAQTPTNGREAHVHRVRGRTSAMRGRHLANACSTSVREARGLGWTHRRRENGRLRKTGLARAWNEKERAEGRGGEDGEEERTRVRFSVTKRVEYGSEIAVVGSNAQLGEWDAGRALQMQWTRGHVWVATADLNLTPGSVLEYKYVVLDQSHEAHWQQGPNRQLPMPKLCCSDALEVHDTWIFEKTQCIEFLESSLTKAPSDTAWEMENLRHAVEKLAAAMEREKENMARTGEETHRLKEQGVHLSNKSSRAEEMTMAQAAFLRTLELENVSLSRQLAAQGSILQSKDAALKRLRLELQQSIEQRVKLAAELLEVRRVYYEHLGQSTSPVWSFQSAGGAHTLHDGFAEYSTEDSRQGEHDG